MIERKTLTRDEVTDLIEPGLLEKRGKSMEQIDKLADFIMSEVPGEPSQSEGAGDCAIRVIKELQLKLSEASARPVTTTSLACD